MIDLIMFCPKCGLQHIDGPEDHKPGCNTQVQVGPAFCDCGRWDNPPHKSHLCRRCGHIWRPADIATNGVAEIRSIGEKDHRPVIRNNCR